MPLPKPLKPAGRAREASGGFYLEPSLIDEVGGDNILAQEEVFGPVLSFMTFEDEQDATKIANGTICGLASGGGPPISGGPCVRRRR